MIGNETTDHVIIVDTMGNIVFAGGTSGDENISSVNNQISARTELEKSFSDKVKNLLMSSNIADTVSVSTTLDVDFDTGRSVNTTYSVPEDMNQGYWSERHVTSSENTGESGGTPGTASNDSDDGSTTYEISADSSSSLVETTDEYYLVNQLVEENESKGGVINLENSSISVTLTKIRVYSEEELRAQGALDDMTYQEYQYQNSDTVIGTVENDMVDPVLITHVSKAAGIPEDQISVVANIIPFYQTPEEGFDVTNYLQLIVFVLIVLLLAFVVWRSTRRIVIAQSEPELSVEQLLAATAQEPPLDDIDLQEKSEARVAIEKFVDENPEAVALLLRSWLEADWD
jgi:flagellar M-ring protein FliF